MTKIRSNCRDVRRSTPKHDNTRVSGVVKNSKANHSQPVTARKPSGAQSLFAEIEKHCEVLTTGARTRSSNTGKSKVEQKIQNDTSRSGDKTTTRVQNSANSSRQEVSRDIRQPSASAGGDILARLGSWEEASRKERQLMKEQGKH